MIFDANADLQHTHSHHIVQFSAMNRSHSRLELLKRLFAIPVCWRRAICHTHSVEVLKPRFDSGRHLPPLLAGVRARVQRRPKSECGQKVVFEFLTVIFGLQL